MERDLGSQGDYFTANRTGSEGLQSSPQFVPFTPNEKANNLLNDLQRHPHAFVIACVMDRQIKAEKAWVIPYWFAERLGGTFEFSKLAELTPDQVRDLMTKPPPSIALRKS